MTPPQSVAVSGEVAEFLEVLPPRWSRALLWVTLALALGLGLWACMVRVDITVTGRGVLTKEGPPDWVRVPAAGRISEVWVRAGDAVRAGDPLFSVQTGTGLDAARVVAPLDGQVLQERVSPGALMDTHEGAVSLAPESEPYDFEAILPNRDIGKVEVGMAVSIHLDAYPVESFGPLPGRVERFAPVLDSPDHSYRVVCSLGRQTLETVQGNVTLRPELTGTVELVLGQQRLVDLVLKPLD